MLIFFLGSSNTLKYFPRADLKACPFPLVLGISCARKLRVLVEGVEEWNCMCNTGSESSPAPTGPGQGLGRGHMALCSETCRVCSCYHNGDSQEGGLGRGDPASRPVAPPSATLGAGDSPARGFSLQSSSWGALWSPRTPPCPGPAPTSPRQASESPSSSTTRATSSRTPRSSTAGTLETGMF